MVLVGPSGCGKSTALRMLAGLEKVSDGRILIGDRVVNNVAPQHRDIAMVFQSYALYPHMTVYDNLAFGLRNQKVPKKEIDSRVRRAANILDLDALIKRKPKQLSGGQRQRVALGRAIVREPAGVSDGRATVEPGCAAPRADPRRDPEAAAGARDDDHLRHARSGRGDDDGRPHRRHEARRPAAGRAARGALPRAAEPVRRRLHRFARDEPRARRDPGRRRWQRPDRRLPARAHRPRATAGRTAWTSTRASRSWSISATSNSCI